MFKRRSHRKKLQPIEQKKNQLLNLLHNFNFWFEDTVESRMHEINKELENLIEKKDEIEQEIEQYEEDNIVNDENGRPNEEYYDLFSELGGIDCEIDFLLQQKLSIEEMKIVYLYKEFEIIMKEILCLAFQHTDKQQLFKWENVKSLLKNHDILIGDIRNYNKINELRIINNNIKHSREINDQVHNANILEFVSIEEFDSDSLCNFYNRIKNEPVKFLNFLIEKIIEYLFVFDDERIERIACCYENRLDKNTATKLANKIIEKCT